MNSAIVETNFSFPGLKNKYIGKVRDVYYRVDGRTRRPGDLQHRRADRPRGTGGWQVPQSPSSARGDRGRLHSRRLLPGVRHRFRDRGNDGLLRYDVPGSRPGPVAEWGRNSVQSDDGLQLTKEEFRMGSIFGWMWRFWFFFIRWIAPTAIIIIILQKSGIIDVDTFINSER